VRELSTSSNSLVSRSSFANMLNGLWTFHQPDSTTSPFAASTPAGRVAGSDTAAPVFATE
jgi:hypothetical protein